MGILKRAISKDASAVSRVLDATDIVNKIESIHKQVRWSLLLWADFLLQRQ